jgi:hypothetical protein
MPCCFVKVPFGEEIVADLVVDYEVDCCETIDCDGVSVQCDGFWVGRVGEADRHYVEFKAKFGPETALRDQFVEAAKSVWMESIIDACLRHADENKAIRRFVRS